MTRRYARGLGGVRIAEATPQGHWKIHTILGAMGACALTRITDTNRKIAGNLVEPGHRMPLPSSIVI